MQRHMDQQKRRANYEPAGAKAARLRQLQALNSHKSLLSNR